MMYQGTELTGTERKIYVDLSLSTGYIVLKLKPTYTLICFS